MKKNEKKNTKKINKKENKNDSNIKNIPLEFFEKREEEKQNKLKELIQTSKEKQNKYNELETKIKKYNKNKKRNDKLSLLLVFSYTILVTITIIFTVIGNKEITIKNILEKNNVENLLKQNKTVLIKENDNYEYYEINDNSIYYESNKDNKHINIVDNIIYIKENDSLKAYQGKKILVSGWAYKKDADSSNVMIILDKVCCSIDWINHKIFSSVS